MDRDLLGLCLVALAAAAGTCQRSPAADAAEDWVDVKPKQEGGVVATPETLAKIVPEPGQTIWLKGGEYKDLLEDVVLTKGGEAGKPVIYRAVPGEAANFVSSKPGHPKLRGHLWLWGVGVMKNPGGGVDLVTIAENIRLINCMIADNATPTPEELKSVSPAEMGVKLKQTGCGIGFWAHVTDAEIYGCLIYNNGANSLDHGIYTKNYSMPKEEAGQTQYYDQPWKRILDNIIFENSAMGCGIHVHGSSGSLAGYYIAGNILFASGFGNSSTRAGANAHVGPYGTVSRLTVCDNALYHPKNGTSGLNTEKARNMYLGYTAKTGNKDVHCIGNYIAGGSVALRMQHFTDAKVCNNSFVNGGTVEFAEGQEGVRDNQTIPDPKGSNVFKRVNQYDLSRVHLAIYNWDRQDSVKADMKGVLKPGSAYRLVSVYHAARNEWGKPVAQGTYEGGEIAVPMKTGQSRWEPEFAAFILLRDYAPRADLKLTKLALARGPKTTGREAVEESSQKKDGGR